MTVTATQENSPAVAWKAACERSAKFTKAEPITSRRLLSTFRTWPKSVPVRRIGREDPDLVAAELALNEPGERVPYSDLRKEIGL